MILDKLNTIFSEAMEREIKLSPGDSYHTVQGWDSLAHVKIIILLEETFNITVSQQQHERTGTVQGIIEVLKEAGVNE